MKIICNDNLKFNKISTDIILTRDICVFKERIARQKLTQPDEEEEQELYDDATSAASPPLPPQRQQQQQPQQEEEQDVYDDTLVPSQDVYDDTVSPSQDVYVTFSLAA